MYILVEMQGSVEASVGNNVFWFHYCECDGNNSEDQVDFSIMCLYLLLVDYYGSKHIFFPTNETSFSSTCTGVVIHCWVGVLQFSCLLT